MKQVKKLAGFLLALVMVMGLSVTALAYTGSASIEITGVPSNSHEFTAYQIFDGDLDESTGKLSNVVWGGGVSSGDNALAAAQAITIDDEKPFENCANAAEVAAILAASNDDADVVKAFAATMKGVLGTASGSTSSGTESGTTYTYTITGVDYGYYLVTDSTTATTDDAVSAYILYIADATETIAFKNDIPTVTKTIVDATTDNEYGTSASAGDTVTFKLTGTVPDSKYLSNYETYWYLFTDTLSYNLNYAEGSVEVKIDGTALSLSSNYTVDWSKPYLYIEILNAKDYAGKTIEVTYNATLSDSASAGNEETNKVKISYYNDPNSTDIGTTEEKIVYVYTFDLTVYKVDSDGDPLEGAAFTLYKSADNGDTYTVEVKTISDVTTFTFNDLGEGYYKLVESTVPDGYNKVDDIEFTITAEYSEGGTIEGLNCSIEDFTASYGEGTISGSIENKSGSVLPTTGGMGTTIFYVIGTVLVLGAAVILITRRRMRAE